MNGISYAKVNLALNVTNKSKPSNLHTLDMINICVSLYDKIKIDFFKDGNDIQIICNNPKVPTNNKNTVYKIVEKFKKVFNLSFSCKIEIIKNIPTESGLGGSSGNAAKTLEMLDKYYKTNMTVQQKMKFIEDITSDGSYMVISSPARVKGTGNIIQPYKVKPIGKILLVKPKTGCSTKNIYGSLDYKNLVHPNINKVEEALLNNDLELLKKNVGNSLLTAAMKDNNEIDDIIKRLRTCGFDIVSMSGSGSTCFGYTNKKEPFERAKQIINNEKYDLVKICTIISSR